MTVLLAGALSDVDPVMFEGLCVLEVLARLGFPKERVGVLTGGVEDPSAALMHERLAHGDRCLFVRVVAPALSREVVLAGQEVPHVHEATVTIAVGPAALEGFSARWAESMRAVERAPRDEGARAFRASRAFAHLPAICAALRARGIRIPRDAS